MKVKGEVQITRVDTDTFTWTVYHDEAEGIDFPEFSWPIGATFHVPIESDHPFSIGPFFMPKGEALEQFSIYPREGKDKLEAL